MNGVIVYESIDATFLGIIEQALKDHNIPLYRYRRVKCRAGTRFSWNPRQNKRRSKIC